MSNRFDNRLNVCIHDTTGFIVYTNIQPLVKPVWQPVVSCIQPVVKPVVQPGLTTRFVSCKQTTNRMSNRFDNRLDICLHDTAGWQPVVLCKRGIRLPVYLPASERHCHWPVLFILIGEETCLGSLHDRGMTGDQTCDHQTASPILYPLCHQATMPVPWQN